MSDIKTFELYQIGVDVSCMGNVAMNWYNEEPRQKMIITPSVKDKSIVVIETRDPKLAAAIIEDIRGARVHIEKIQEKTTKI